MAPGERVFMTRHLFPRDEVQSLLQMALRRKEKQLVYQAAKELLLGDQLHWRQILLFLFEDHGLSSADSLQFIFEQYTMKGNQAMFSSMDMMLSNCKTCRLAPSMALAANTYEPRLLVDGKDEALTGLIEPKEGYVDADILLTQLNHAWKTKDLDQVMAYMKVAATVIDMERHTRTVSEKGEKYMLPLNTHSYPDFTLVLLSMLYWNTEEECVKNYIRACYDLASIRALDSMCQSLILFSVVATYRYQCNVESLALKEAPCWLEVEDLKTIPDWAVTIETYRGRTGEPVKYATVRNFKLHGQKQKRDVTHYLTEGILCRDKKDIENPFSETFNEICHKEMRTSMRFTLASASRNYRTRLRDLGSVLINNCSKMTYIRQDRRGVQILTSKRPHVPDDEQIQSKRFMTESNLPTIEGKKNIHADLENNEVLKGPYHQATRLNHTLFHHECLRSVLGDPHTLQVRREGKSVLAFQIIKGTVPERKSSISRESMGLVLMNKVPGREIEELPATMWVHFVYRYAFGLKDSSLHQVIKCKETGDVYGLGMEQGGVQLKETDCITDILFSRTTKERLLASTMKAVKKQKTQILQLLSTRQPLDSIQKLSSLYGVFFDETAFSKKINQAKALLKAI